MVITSLGTFQIAHRGTVKVLPANIEGTIRVGDRAVIDGEAWLIAGIEMMNPRPADGSVGVVVRKVGAP